MADSRTLLLDAAAEEFARYGLKGTRVQSIVQRAGVNERMIYHHFGSKEGLYLATVEHLRLQSGRELAGLIAEVEGLPPYAALRGILGGMFDAFRAHPHLPAMLAHEILAGEELAPFPTAEQLPEGLRAIYEAGQRDGTFRADLPFEIMHMTTMGAVVGLSSFAPRFTASLGMPEWNTATYLRDQVVGQLVDGLTGPPGTPATPAP
jgi:AcrR family transcriptional regulator